MAMPNIRHEELAVIVGQQSAKVDHCHNPDGKIDYVHLGQTGRPESMENGQEKCPGFRYKEEGAKKTSTWVVYTRKRRRPAGPKFENSNTEQKLALFDSSNDSRVDKDLGFEPATPKRKRGRTAHSKCAKNKVVQKPLLVDSTIRSSDKLYFEQEAVEGLLSLRMGGKCTGAQAVTRHLSHGDDDQKKSTRVKGTALDRAVELKRKLPKKGLSFIKRMTPSNVGGGFWMGLPAAFCRKHLPNDIDVVLEDEEGRTCVAKYKAENKGLSGGWRGFAKRHALKVDDALLFHLVRPEVFKVYILRENEFSTADGTKLAWEAATGAKLARKKATCAKLARKEATGAKAARKEATCAKLARKEAIGSSIRSPDSNPHVFATVNSPADFKIPVDRGFLTCITDRQQETYYCLCQARKAFLHAKANPDLAVDMIVKTVKIAEGIMASSSTSLQGLAAWRKRLESLERLGMDVSFMCKRVDDLIELITTDPSPAEVDPERYAKAKLERDGAAKHLRAVETRVSILKDALKEIDAKMEEMVQAGATKKMEQAMRKLPTPW